MSLFHVIYNPNSGMRKTRRAAESVRKILEAQGDEVIFYPTQKAGHCTEIVKEINTSYEDAKVLIIGGDGTFSEALNGIVDFDKITLGLVPCGTGNDFAKKLKIPGNAKKALRKILSGEETLVDFIELEGGKRCLNVCGLGMDVDVLVKYASMKSFKGKIKYYLSLFYVLTHFKPHRVRFVVNGEEAEQDVFMVGVCNGSYIGGGMALAPDNSVKDGTMELVVIDNIPKGMIFFRLIPFLLGRMNKQSCTHTFRSAEAEVEILGEEPARVQVDGEVLEMPKLSCKLIPQRLKMFL